MNRAGILNYGKIQYEKNGSLDGFRETYLKEVDGF
jgi:hypothetical protein